MRLLTYKVKQKEQKMTQLSDLQQAYTEARRDHRNHISYKGAQARRSELMDTGLSLEEANDQLVQEMVEKFIAAQDANNALERYRAGL
jgi:hypothetical protein